MFKVRFGQFEISSQFLCFMESELHWTPCHQCFTVIVQKYIIGHCSVSSSYQIAKLSSFLFQVPDHGVRFRENIDYSILL